MRRSKELYGVEPTEWASLPYKDALRFRIESLRKNLDHYMEIDFMARDDILVTDMQKAVKHNEYLLKEIE